MSDQFRWHTEEEDGWEKTAPEPAAATPSNRRRWLLLLLGLLLAAGGVGWWLQHQTDSAEQQAVAEVEAAHLLVEQAVRTGDEELLSQHLDRTDTNASWRRAQRAALLEMNPQEILGLFALEPAAATRPQVTLSPDLQSATLSYTHAYTVSAPPSGAPPTVTLAYTRYYRRDSDARWRLTQPPEDYWGSTLTTTGQWLTVSYPAHDQPIVQQLADRLDRLLIDLCQAINCPGGLQIDLILSYDQNRFEWLNNPNSTLRPPGARRALPTPSLVGLPVDPAGFDALYRAYATYMLHWTNRALAEQGVAPSTAELTKLFDLRPPSLQPPAGDNGPGPTAPAVDIFCSRLAPDPGLYRFHPAANRLDTLLADRSISAATTAPAGGFWLVENGPEHAQLLRWTGDSASPQLLHTADTPLSGYLPHSPTGQALALTTAEGEESQTVLLDLAECAAGGCPARSLPGWPSWSPDGRHLLAQTQGGNPSIFLGGGRGENLLPLTEGYNPFWLDPSRFGYLDLSRGFSQPEFNFYGIEGATLPEEPYASLSTEFLYSLLPDVRPNRHLSLPGADVRDNLLYISVATYGEIVGEMPQAHTFSLLRVTPPQPGRQWDPVSNVTLLATLPTSSYFSPSISPDGRWLLVTHWSETKQNILLTLYDLAGLPAPTLPAPVFSYTYPVPLPSMLAPGVAGQGLPYPDPYWSDDGQWLLVGYDGLLHFMQPESGRDYLLSPLSPGCLPIGWASPSNPP